MSTINLDGKYISLVDFNDDWSFSVTQCYIKSDEQIERDKQLTRDNIITVKGKITDVGEVMGYYMDINLIE